MGCERTFLEPSTSCLRGKYHEVRIVDASCLVDVIFRWGVGPFPVRYGLPISCGFAVAAGGGYFCIARDHSFQ